MIGEAPIVQSNQAVSKNNHLKGLENITSPVLDQNSNFEVLEDGGRGLRGQKEFVSPQTCQLRQHRLMSRRSKFAEEMMRNHPLKAVKLWAWSGWDLEGHCLLGVAGVRPTPSDITKKARKERIWPSSGTHKLRKTGNRAGAGIRENLCFLSPTLVVILPNTAIHAHAHTCARASLDQRMLTSRSWELLLIPLLLTVTVSSSV